MAQFGYLLDVCSLYSTANILSLPNHQRSEAPIAFITQKEFNRLIARLKTKGHSSQLFQTFSEINIASTQV